MNRFTNFILQAILLTATMSAYAQSEPGQWVDDLYLVKELSEFPIQKVLIDEKNNIHKTIPNIAKAADFPVPHRYRFYSFSQYWHNDALYTTAFGASEKNEKGSVFSRTIFAKWEEGKWHYIGDYKTEPEVLLTLIPCDNDRFILVSSKKDLINDNRLDRSPFHRMSVNPNKTEIRLDSSIDYGIDEIRHYMFDTTCFDIASNSHVIMTDNYATLVSPKTGLYWIFSLETASLKKAGMIFNNKVTPEMIAKGGFPNAILCVNPEKDGNILISAQTEEALTTETADVDKEIQEMQQNFPTITLEEIIKILGTRQKEIANRNPIIMWYRIYPDTGKFEKLSLPPDGAELVREGTKNDVWRPMPDGSVVMGSFEMKEVRKEAKDDSVKKGEEDKKETKQTKPPPKTDDPPTKNI